MNGRWVSTATAAALLAGCMTVGDVDDGFRRIDRVWQLEYQQTEDEYRYRVIDAPYGPALLAVRRTFVDLGMPVQDSSITAGVIVAENNAPTPLSPLEWQEVAKIENPRLQQVAGPLFVLGDDPKDYVVTVSATVRPFKGKTLVLLEYALDNPKLRRKGLAPSKHAPAKAVQIGSLKFWGQLEKRLREVKVPPPRRRTKLEMDA